MLGVSIWLDPVLRLLLFKLIEKAPPPPLINTRRFDRRKLSSRIMSAKRGGGSFRERRVENMLELKPRDFGNPWNFYGLFSRSEDDVHNWCRQNGILASTFPCPYNNCDGQMNLKALARAPGGSIFRCSKNRDHTKSSRTYSFFDKSNLMLQDIMVFIKSYLEKSSLALCARFSGMAYGSTAVNWGSFIRELFKEYFYKELRHRKLQGVIEIDESLFGRRVKFHRGNPNRGLKVLKTNIKMAFLTKLKVIINV